MQIRVSMIFFQLSRMKTNWTSYYFSLTNNATIIILADSKDFVSLYYKIQLTTFVVPSIHSGGIKSALRPFNLSGTKWRELNS